MRSWSTPIASLSPDSRLGAFRAGVVAVLPTVVVVFSEDEVGRCVLERLARKAAEGIDVRLLLDDVGSLHARKILLG